MTSSDEPTQPTVPATRRRRRSTETDAPRRRRRWPWIVGGVAVVLVGLGIVAAIFAQQAFSVRDDLLDARKDLSQIGALVAKGDTAAVEPVAEQLRERTARAASTVQGPLWQAALAVPGVGPNVDAVRRAAIAVDLLVTDAIPPALQIGGAADLENLSLKGGGIDLAPFRDAGSSLTELADAFGAAKAEIDPIDESSLLPVVRDSVVELTGVIDQAAPALDVVSRYLPSLLRILGDGEERTYLILFQNNAEIRATGGNPAASMILGVRDGKLILEDQASSATFYAAGTVGDTHTRLPAETLSLYPDTFTRFSQDYTMTPDFPTTATLFQDLWQSTSGERFDGVISLDPVALSHILAVTGPVKLANGDELTSENAVKSLLSDAYERYPTGIESDLYFADAAKRVFEELSSGGWDPLKMLEALELSASEQRVSLAMTDPAEQELSRELGVDGALTADNVAATQVGVYLNDFSVGKLEYHLQSTMAATCDVSARTVTTTVTLTNTIPNSIQSSYTLGARNGRYGLPRTTMMLDILAFAPPGAKIVGTEPEGGDVASLRRSGAESGHQADSVLVEVPQGQTRTYRSTMQLPDGPLGPLELRHSPTATTTPVTIDASCGALFGK